MTLAALGATGALLLLTAPLSQGVRGAWGRVAVPLAVWAVALTAAVAGIGH